MTPEPTLLVTVLPCDQGGANAIYQHFGFNSGTNFDVSNRVLQLVARHRLAALEEAAPSLHLASNWLRACSDWLLSNDLDMKMPAGVLDADPLDIADALDAIRSLSQPQEESAGAPLAHPTPGDYPCK